MLSPEMRQQVSQLQAKASKRRLGLLIGAGISVPSGLPSWGGLLNKLAARAGFSEAEQGALSNLGFLDQPTLIEERMGGEQQFKAAVADCTKNGRYTPAHAILGSMRLPACTTNFDDVYEKAVESASDGVEVEKVMRLPWDASRLAMMPDGTRRLLKLHGCVSEPSSIVLTRGDYMRYKPRAVLAPLPVVV